MLVMLGAVLFCLFLGNVVYHKYRFETMKDTLHKGVDYQRKYRNIRVVIYNDHREWAVKRIDVVRDSMNHNPCIDLKKWEQEKYFYAKYQINGDTLILPDSILYATVKNKKPEIVFYLPHLTAYYFNGKLIKQFNAKQ